MQNLHMIQILYVGFEKDCHEKRAIIIDSSVKLMETFLLLIFGTRLQPWTSIAILSLEVSCGHWMEKQPRVYMGPGGQT